MQALLNVSGCTVAYLDNPPTSSPLQRPVDVQTSKSGIAVQNPSTQGFVVPAYGSLTLFSTVVSTSIDNTSAFNITLSPLSVNRYRVTNTGGTAPAFRTDRGLALSTGTVTISDLGNNSATLTTTVSSGLSAVQLGDTVFIPGPVTGDAATVFNTLNQGFWVVIGLNSSTSITITRPAGVDYSAVTETRTPGSDAAVDAFGAAGVQVGNSVDLNLGNFPQVLGVFTVLAVTSTWFEFTSTLPLPLVTGVEPGTTGMVFFNGAKRYLELFADQSCQVQLNGNTGSNDRIDPWFAGDPNLRNWGFLKKSGLAYEAVVVNRTAQSLNLLLATAE